MFHLEDKLAEYVFEELPASELSEARRHLESCADCRQRVEEFQRIQNLLKIWPDVDPPRHVLVPVEGHRGGRWIAAGWLVPWAAAAALLLGVFLAGPIYFEWQDSRLTIAFGKPLTKPVTEVVTVREAVDYQRIVQEVRKEQQAWIAGEFQKMSVAQSREIQRVRGEIAYLENMQRAVWKDTLENASSIQLLASRTDSKE